MPRVVAAGDEGLPEILSGAYVLISSDDVEIAEAWGYDVIQLVVYLTDQTDWSVHYAPREAAEALDTLDVITDYRPPWGQWRARRAENGEVDAPGEPYNTPLGAPFYGEER